MLRHGAYRQLSVASEQLAFLRQAEEGAAIVAVNAANEAAPMRIPVSGMDDAELTDALDPGFRVTITGGQIELRDVPATGDDDSVMDSQPVGHRWKEREFLLCWSDQ